MNPDIAASIVLVALVLLAAVYVQVVAPRQRRRRLASVLVRQGWVSVLPDEAPVWPAVMVLAVERASGTEQVVQYE